MRAFLLLSLVCVALLASAGSVSRVGGTSDVGSDEWIQPAFVEAETMAEMDAFRPGVNGACGSGGRCLANAERTCKSPNTLSRGLCSGTAVCCVPPRKAVGAGAPAASGGSWQAVRDPKSGKMYYYNTATKKSSWTKPSSGGAAPAASSSGGAAVSTAGRRVAHPGGPLASGPANLVIPADIMAIGAKWTRRARPGPVSNACPRSAPLMPNAVLTQILTAIWTAFGATPAQAQRYAASNLRQVHRESTGCPNVIQSASTRDVNSKTDPAGGLVQFTQSTFKIWHVRGTVNDRMNPVSNLAAAINAQVFGWRMTKCHTGRVLNGCSGWSPDSNKGHNPYAT